MMAARIPFSIVAVLLSLVAAGNSLDCFVCENCMNVTNLKVSTCVEETTTTLLTTTEVISTLSTTSQGKTDSTTLSTTTENISTLPTTGQGETDSTTLSTATTTISTLPTTGQGETDTTTLSTTTTTISTLPTTGQGETDSTSRQTSVTTDATTDQPNSPSIESSSETEQTNPSTVEPDSEDAPRLWRLRRAATEESPFQCVKTVYKDGESERTDRGCQLKIKDEKDQASCARLSGIDEAKVSACGVCGTDSCNSATLIQISLPLILSFVFFITRAFV